MLFAPITLGAESLHEKVKDYLNGFGLPRLEFFMNQDYFYIGEGT